MVLKEAQNYKNISPGQRKNLNLLFLLADAVFTTIFLFLKLIRHEFHQMQF